MKSICIRFLLLISFLFLCGCQSTNSSPSVQETPDLSSIDSNDNSIEAILITNCNSNVDFDSLFHIYLGKSYKKLSVADNPARSILELVKESEQYHPSALYFAINPLLIDQYDFIEELQKNPSFTNCSFSFLLSAPSYDFWKDLSDDSFVDSLGSYSTLAIQLQELQNTTVYYAGNQEWLYCNPSFYLEDHVTLKEDIAQYLYTTTFVDGQYRIAPSQFTEYLSNLRAAIIDRKSRSEVDVDLSGHSIVIFGDSIFGINSYPYAIEKVLSYQFKADVHNYAVGGASASPLYPNCLEEQIRNFLAASPDLTDDVTFVFHFGFNDYFQGYPLHASEQSFKVALESGTRKIRDLYPGATILLMTPYNCVEFDYGTIQHGDEAFILQDVVNAIIEIAEDNHFEIINNYQTLFSNEDAPKYLLGDNIHPNETLCRILAYEIANTILE